MCLWMSHVMCPQRLTEERPGERPEVSSAVLHLNTFPLVWGDRHTDP